MIEKNLEQQLAEINRKLEFLTEQMAMQAQRQRAWQELQDDLSRVGIDLFRSAVTELEEVSHHFDLQDLLHLMKKLLRNTRNFSQLVDRMESAGDLFKDFAPIGRQAFLDLLRTLDEFERKGYFEFSKELFAIIDRIVTTFTVEDVRALGNNVVAILSTIRNLTQPDMLSAVNNAVAVYKNLDVEVSEDLSYWQLLKHANTPETKRGLAVGLQFLRNLSANANVGNGLRAPRESI